MKILYVSLDPRQPFDALTGGARHMGEVVRALREEGHEVMVFGKSGDAIPISRRNKYYVPRFPRLKKVIPSFLWLLARDLNDIRMDRKREPEIARALAEFKPDVVYERNSYLFVSCARAAVDLKVPYFLEINAPTVEERRKHFGAPLASWQRRVEAFQFGAAHGIVVVSEPLKKYLIDLGVDAEKIKVIPNGVRPEEFEGARERGATLRRELNLDGPVIGFVGSLADYHGLDRLMDAVNEVRVKYPNAKALIVGGGPLLEKTRELAVRKKCADSMLFVGQVDPGDVPGYIGSFDVGVLPRTADYTSPIKLFEYGAVGIPIIAPRTAPVASIMGNRGALIDESDSLAEAILALLNDIKKATAMGNEFRKHVLSRYTWRHSAKSILSFIAEKTR